MTTCGWVTTSLHPLYTRPVRDGRLCGTVMHCPQSPMLPRVMMWLDSCWPNSGIELRSHDDISRSHRPAFLFIYICRYTSVLIDSYFHVLVSRCEHVVGFICFQVFMSTYVHARPGVETQFKLCLEKCTGYFQKFYEGTNRHINIAPTIIFSPFKALM